MKEKCSKYEGLFIFADKDTFESHVAECEDCRIEHEKMQKVSELLKEVKPYYRAKNKYKTKIIAACAAFCMVLFSSTLCYLYNESDIADSIMYGKALSAEDLGFPVDSYGLLMVD